MTGRLDLPRLELKDDPKAFARRALRSMTGNSPRPAGTPDDQPRGTAPPSGNLRRIDSSHSPRRPHLARYAPDESAAADLQAVESNDTPNTTSTEAADESLCDQIADRLMSTQAAQLAEYLRNRQSELLRRQQQLDQQQQTLESARLAFEAQRQAQEHDFATVPGDAFLEPQPTTASRDATAPKPASRPLTDRRSATPPAAASSSPAVSAEPDPTSNRQAAVAEQLLREVRHTHQETLELRLATEQLWGQIVERAPSEDVSRTLRTFRERWQRQQRQAQEELAAQQAELRELLDTLDQRQTHLRRQRRDLQTWVDRRYQEFDQIAGQLLVRQQELERQQRQFEQRRKQYEDELLQCQRQIKQLTAQLRCQEELGRVA